MSVAFYIDDQGLSSKMNPQRPVMELFDPDIIGNFPPSSTERSLNSPILPDRASSHIDEEDNVYFTLVIIALCLAVFVFILYFGNKFARYIRRVILAATREAPESNTQAPPSSPPPKNRDAPPEYDGPPPYEVAIRMSAIEDPSVGSLSKYVSSSIIV